MIDLRIRGARRITLLCEVVNLSDPLEWGLEAAPEL